MADESDDHKVPVTVLTGFLGSGKTTLLNHILTAPHGKKLAIIENEFGEVGIDDELLAENTKMQAEEEIIEMMNGCICCTVRQDLVTILSKLAKRTRAGALQLDGIIIETTGMADPAPVAQTFFVNKAVEAFARLDGIVTLIDAKHIEQHLDEEKPEGAENEAVEQVAFADRLLLNKTDLVPDEADLARIEARLRAINNFAPIQRCQDSLVDVASVLDIHGVDLKRTLEMDPEFLNSDGEHVHDATVTSFGILEPRPVSIDLVREWMANMLLPKKGKQLYRMKGILSVAGDDTKFVYQAVHMINVGGFTEEWAPDEPRVSKLMFIGKDLDKEELQAGFDACLATPENMAVQLARLGMCSLRFAVGDRVECQVGKDSWAKGAIIKHGFWTGRAMCPYQVKLDEDGSLIYAPQDDDIYIRAEGKGAAAPRAAAPAAAVAAGPPPPPPSGMAAWGQFMAK